MADIYGSDVSTYTSDGEGLDPLFALITGERVVLENVARRLETGHLIDAENYGYDLIAKVGMRTTHASLVRVADAIVAECKKEEAVVSAACEIEVINRLEWNVRIALKLITGAPAFKLVLKVTDVTLEILSADRGG